jgi:hypothetical protein
VGFPELIVVSETSLTDFSPCRMTVSTARIPGIDHNNHVQAVGAAKQDEILLHEAESWLPTLVFFTASQNMNTTRSRIIEYSTNPWPLFSRSSLRNNSMSLFLLV